MLFASFHAFLFLLTRPLRDVTVISFVMNSTGDISTHTPLAGRDWNVLFKTNSNTKFLLTRPLRDVTIMLINSFR